MKCLKTGLRTIFTNKMYNWKFCIFIQLIIYNVDSTVYILVFIKYNKEYIVYYKINTHSQT